MLLYLDLTLMGAQLLGLDFLTVYPSPQLRLGDTKWQFLLWHYLSIQCGRHGDPRNHLIHQHPLPAVAFRFFHSPHAMCTDMSCQGCH